MWKRGYLMVLGAFGALALVLAACAPAAEPPTTTQPATTTQQTTTTTTTTTEKMEEKAPAKATASLSGVPLEEGARFGGVLRKSYTQEGPTFSQWEEKGGVAASAGQPLTNGLVRIRTWGDREDYQNQAYFELHPDLAASWEQSANGLQWTFNLRDGVKFSDGQAFTCADAKWSLDAVRTGEGLRRSPLAAALRVISDIQCPNDLTMVVSLKNPKQGLLEAIGAPNIVVMPRHVYVNDMDKIRKEPNIGSGPFTLKQWIPQEKYVFERKADYWDQPLPYLDGMESVFLSRSAEPQALRAGRIDVGPIFGLQGAPADTLIKECAQCQIWAATAAQGTSAVMVNHQRPPWNNPLVKDALSYAIDRAKSVKLSRGGWYVLPSGGPFYPGSYWAMPEERMKAIPGYDFSDPEGNKQKARDLLAQAGYKPGELVIPFGVGVYSTEESVPVIEDLTSVGFKVESQQFEVGRTYEIMGAGDFDVFIHGFWDGGVDPDFPLYEQFYTGSDRNYNRYSNPEYDRLVDLQSATIDREERRRLAWDAAELAFREHAKHYQTAGGLYAPIFGGNVRGLLPGPAHNSYGAVQRFDHVWLAKK